MSVPLRATARLQFHKDFTLDDGAAIVPYLASLGISHVYASPLLKSSPGSAHGYDTIDCSEIDPERGGLAGLERLAATLRAHDMGLILDIVPNHMGVAQDGNTWWDDVLAHGQDSLFAGFFDIDWSPRDPTLRGRVLLPFLGASLSDTLDHGDIALVAHDTHGFAARYADRHYPIKPAHHAEIRAILAKDADTFATGTTSGRQRLSGLLGRQSYRLVSWRAGNALINWRRFFNVTSLAALRMEDETVFEAAHATVFSLYERGLIDGVRADHVDGLTQPAAYCRRLHGRLESLRSRRPDGLRDQEPIIYVEKILRRGEPLPSSWPVTGTTGYEFLEDVSLLLHDPRGEAPITDLWSGIAPGDFGSIEHAARREMLASSFSTELDRLTDLCATAAAQRDPDADYTKTDISACLTAIFLHFPTYRSYFADIAAGGTPEARDALRFAIGHARDTSPPHLRGLVAWLGRLIEGSLDGVHPTTHQAIAAQFEHLTAPLAAKAGEDTAFYRYGRALSRVDVGGDPSVFASGVAPFHDANKARRAQMPHSMITTATHDHKRGADTRARLAVLSEPAAAWPQTVRAWLAQHASLRGTGPVQADAFWIYQAVLGAWPTQGFAHEQQRVALRDRLQAFLTKALREAGSRTGWSAPDTRYEAACARFLDRLIAPGAICETMEAYLAKLAPATALNSLSQTLLRLTAPGVPDLYQGTELWDLSLVDPDNRRPVDYEERRSLLARDEAFTEAASHWNDGAAQQCLVATLLRYRRDKPDLFALGSYEPLAVTGPLAQHFVAFLRRDSQGSLLVIAPRLMLGLNPGADLSLTDHRLSLTRMALPASGAPWQSLLSPDRAMIDIGGDLGFLSGSLPIAVLAQDA